MIARLLILVLFAAGLAGCNLVVTEEPVLSLHAGASRLVLAPGLWVVDDDSCRLAPGAPPAAWPDCAEWFLSRDGRLAFSQGRVPAGSAFPPNPDGAPVDMADYYLAPGHPNVLQMGTSKPPTYYYIGVEPDDGTSAATLSAMTLWLVQCGPANTNGDQKSRAQTPFPGLRFTPADSQNCTTDSPDVIFEAARRSRALQPVKHAHLVRADAGGAP